MSRHLRLVAEAKIWRPLNQFRRAVISAFTVLAILLLGSLPAALALGNELGNHQSVDSPALLQTLHSHPSGTSPLAPKPIAGQSLAINFDAITPSSLGKDGTVTISATVTNTSNQRIEKPQIQIGVKTEKPRDRAALTSWANRTDMDDLGETVARTARNGETPNSPLSDPNAQVNLPLRIAAPSALEPGKATQVTFQLPGRLLPFDSSPNAWGPRPFALSVKDGNQVLAVARSFIIWMPSEVPIKRLQYSFLLPITNQTSADPVRNPEAFTNSVQNGRLKQLMDLAATPSVNWLLDPALLDPPVTFEQSNADEPPGKTDSSTADTSVTQDDEQAKTPDKTPVSPDKSEKPSATTTKDQAPQPLPAAQTAAKWFKDNQAGRGIIFMPYQNTDLVAVSQIVPTATSAIRSQLQEGRKRATANTKIDAQNTVVLDANRANTEELHVAAHANVQALVVPSINVPRSSQTITPSGVGQLTTADDRALPVLIPDTTLSTIFTKINNEQQVRGTQRILAETAFIAAEPTARPRQILISPAVTEQIDTKAAITAISALSNAGWLDNQPINNLVQAGSNVNEADAKVDPEWDKQGTPIAGQLLTAGHITTLQPAHYDGNVWQTGTGKTGADNEVINSDQASTIESVNLKIQKLATAQAAFTEPTVTQPLMRQLLGLIGPNLRSNPDVLQTEYSNTMAALRKFYGAVKVVPVSSYNLVASSAGVPVTIRNDLPTGVAVKPKLTSDKKILKISNNIPDFTVPARSQASVTVPVEAITSGKVNLEIQLNTANEVPLGEPSTVALVVNPEWENTTTLIIVLAMTVLVVVGVFRAKNNRSEARAPGERGAESLPEEVTEKDPV